MPSLKVFISHSAHDDPEATALLKAIEARLSQEVDGAGVPRYVARVDWTDLKPGQPWRSEINTWLEHCDAGIVLVSAKAQKSAFVAHEVSILTHRKNQAQDFFLLPVFLSGIDFGNVSLGGLSPAQIGELQPVRHDSGDLNQTLDQLVQALQPVQAKLVQPDRQTLEVARLLKKVDADVLKLVAPDFGVRIGPWDSVKDQEQRLAMLLMSMDLMRARQIIEKLKGDWWKDSDLKVMYYLVAVRWVDPRAAAMIPMVRDWPRANRNLCLNIAQEVLAKLYVLRALGIPVSNDWFFAPVNVVFGEVNFDNAAESQPFVQDLAKKVRESLKTSLGSSDSELQDDLESFDKEKRPVFVSMPARSLTDSLLKTLRDEFESVTYFFRMREYAKNPAVAEPAGVTWITPEVDALDEVNFAKDFEHQWNILRTRPPQI